MAVRRRPAATTEPEDAPPGLEDDDEPDDGPQQPAKPWHAFLSVRVVIVLSALFGIMHLFLWKLVWDIAMSQDLVRLRGSAREAVDSLWRVVDHL